MTRGGGTVRSRAARSAAVGLLALPLTAGLLVVGAPGASAAVLAPGEGTTYAANTTIGIRADHPMGESELQLTSPDGQTRVVARGGSALGDPGSLAYDLDTSCWTFPSSSCTGRAPAPNGTYVVTQTGSATDRVSFVLRIPPAAPEGVTAEVVDPKQVRLSWRLGAEPDLATYVVTEAQRTVKELSAGSCEARACSTTIAYADDGSGDHSYTVTALRRDGGSGSVASAPSGASATLAAPAQEPSPGPSEPGAGDTGGADGGPTDGAGAGGPTDGGTADGGGTSGGGSAGGTSGGSAAGTPSARPSSGSTSGGGTSGGSPITTGSAPTTEAAVRQAVAQRKAFALSFSAFGPKLGIPKLPPLPQAQAPDVAPLEEGEFESTLGFEDQVVTERVESQSPAQRVTTVVSEALDSEQLVRSTAAALVLLLMGAHVRRWLAAGTEE